MPDHLQPNIFPWYDADAYPSIYGKTEVSSVTFAKFGKRHCPTTRRDFAVAGHDPGALAADAWHPVSLRQTEMVDVEFESVIYLQRPNPGWLSGQDCIDMDCDGPKVRNRYPVFLYLLQNVCCLYLWSSFQGNCMTQIFNVQLCSFV